MSESMFMKIRKTGYVVAVILLFFYFACFSVASFTISCKYITVYSLYVMDRVVFLLNICLVLILYFTCVLLTGRTYIGALVASIINTVWAVINYYTVCFRNSPIDFQDIYHATTALNVVGSYTFEFDENVREITLCFIIQLFFVFLLWFIRYLKNKRNLSANTEVLNTDDKEHKEDVPVEKNRKSKILVFLGKLALLLLFAIAVMYFGFFAKKSIIPDNTISCHWVGAYTDYGYLPCTINSYIQMKRRLQKPEQYSEEYVQELYQSLPEQEVTTENRKYPDIIFIFNESFADLSTVADFTTDVPYISNFYSFPNAVNGQIVVPVIGGGTENSEFELLTGNSYRMIQGLAPFVNLNLKKRGSVVHDLRNAGYYTIGIHTENSGNYARGKVYPDLGFIETHFKDDITNREPLFVFGFMSDRSLYKNMLTWYREAAKGEAPVFCYTLTIQNHGGFNKIPDEFDTVHVQEDFGDLNSKMNEYLSSIKSSDEAFAELIQEFENSDRDVVIIMAGDHLPMFAPDLIPQELQELPEVKLCLKTTPMVIWNNCGIDFGQIDQSSLLHLIPMVMEKLGIPMSPYNRYICNMRKEVPIIGAFGLWYDGNYQPHSYEEASKTVNDYFILEYDNIFTDRNYSDSK